MTISILTIFPEMVKEILQYGVIGRAQEQKLVTIQPVDLRIFTTDKHRSVDDKPFGGGPGMVMKVDVIDRALKQVTSDKPQVTSRKIALLSPQGKQFDQSVAAEYTKLDHLLLICGRYEGVDQRVADHLVDEQLSVGPYVLSGGEIPAMAVVDAVTRLLPGVVGNPESLINESFSVHPNNQLPITNSPIFDFPQYTHPVEYNGWTVPDVLRSGNHQEIEAWRNTTSDASSSKVHFRTS